MYRVTGWVKNVHTDCTGTVKITTDTSTLTGDPQTDFTAATQLYQQSGNATWTYFDTATGVGNVTATGKSMRLWLDAASTNNKSSPNRVQAYDNITVTKVSDPAPTQLGFSGLSASGWVNQPFSVTVQAQDASGYPQCVTNATTITLSKASGGGTLSGTLTGVIPNGASSVTISDPVLQYGRHDDVDGHGDGGDDRFGVRHERRHYVQHPIHDGHPVGNE